MRTAKFAVVTTSKGRNHMSDWQQETPAAPEEGGTEGGDDAGTDTGGGQEGGGDSGGGGDDMGGDSA